MILNGYRDRAYSIAKAHGFHDEEYPDEHLMMLVITEVAEAVQADRKGKHADVGSFNMEMTRFVMFNEPQPIHKVDTDDFFKDIYRYHIEGTVESELADVVIRLLDLAGLRNIDVNRNIFSDEVYVPFAKKLTLTEYCFWMVKELTSHKWPDYGISYPICTGIQMVRVYCKEKGIDFLWHIEQKMKYNQLRPYKHGNKKY